MLKYEFDQELKSCIVCESQNVNNSLTDHRGIKITTCKTCGFQFMNPQYSNKYLEEYYSNYTTDEDFDHWKEALAYGHNFNLSMIEKHIRVGHMLDIGCGNGHLLEAATKRGWKATGYDVDKKSTQLVSDRLGVDVHSGDFFSESISGKYDLITMHQVLEHLKNPNQYIEKIRSLLNVNGYVFIAVPNIKSLSNRLKRYLEIKGIRKKSIGKYYDTSHHILYFEPNTLTKLLNKHGFRVIYQRNCHSTRPKQSTLKRFLMRNITDHLYAQSTFFVIAKKEDK